MLFNLFNLPYWLILGMGVLLFLIVIVSGSGDNDLELDSDADLDADVDADGEAFSVSEALAWLGIGKAPLILLLAVDLSLIGVFGWMLNVAIAVITHHLPSGFWSGVVFAIALVAALLSGSAIARPVGKVFESFGEDTSRDRLIGCVGTVGSAVIPYLKEKRIGQVDVLDSARNRVTVHAMLPDWATATPRLGDRVVVIDRQADSYLVILKDSPDQEHWFNTNA
jgi:hypothetical protein